MTPLPGAPADDHAHLCNHAPDASGDTQGCPRWPSCLGPGAFLVGVPKLTKAEMLDFERRFIEALHSQNLAFHVDTEAVLGDQGRGPLQRLRRWRRR